MTSNDEPKLAPPGAGLPAMELFIARVMFKWRRWRGSRESFAAKFEHERKIIRSLLGSCDTETAGRRVLIKRLPGLEDSSRYWSAWMTLDHLRIVNGNLARVIRMLAAGEKIPGAANTAAVKPAPDVTASVVNEYEKACDALVSAARTRELKTAGRYVHPWFGPLDAFGWHALAASHMAIHRGQIQEILKAASPPR